MPEPPERTPEFDSYAREYSELIRDPLREKFAAESRFFAERKLQVIQAFFRGMNLETRNMTWLDVGCGFGDLLKMGRASFASVKGCDPSKEMLGAAGDLDVRHQPSDVELPFDSHSFDFVTAVCVYHHIAREQRGKLTAEIMRVMRPGGIFALIEHNPWNPVTRLIVSRSPVDQHAILLYAGEGARMAQAAGAAVLQTRYFLFLPESFYRRAGWVENAARSIPLGGQYVVFSRSR
jgi:SAM-dependent methyltransferase